MNSTDTVETPSAAGGICDDAEDVGRHWETVGKNADGRVTEDEFVYHFQQTAFGQNAAAKSFGDAYELYLKDLFNAGWAMMPHKDQSQEPTLGGHCFKAVAKLPFEFYSDGANGGFCNTAAM